MYKLKVFKFSLLLLFSISVFAKKVEKIGDALQFFLPVSTIGITFYEKDIDGFWQFSKSQIASGLITKGLKSTISSERPNKINKNSFPSGHASITFSAAEFLRKRYDSKYSTLAYALASFSAYSRLHANQHYCKDILAGSILGVTISRYFTTGTSNKNLSLISKDDSLLLYYNQYW